MRDRSGLETDVAVRGEPGTVPPPPPAMRLQRMLGLAFLGGLILNLMPCVFPVLAMKAVGSGAARRAAGRAGRRWPTPPACWSPLPGWAPRCWRRARPARAAGWGFQFQSPVFVAAMAWLLFAVGLNLSGVFRSAPA